MNPALTDVELFTRLMARIDAVGEVPAPDVIPARKLDLVIAGAFYFDRSGSLICVIRTGEIEAMPCA